MRSFLGALVAGLDSSPSAAAVTAKMLTLRHARRDRRRGGRLALVRRGHAARSRRARHRAVRRPRGGVQRLRRSGALPARRLQRSRALRRGLLRPDGGRRLGLPRAPARPRLSLRPRRDRLSPRLGVDAARGPPRSLVLGAGGAQLHLDVGEELPAGRLVRHAHLLLAHELAGSTSRSARAWRARSCARGAMRSAGCRGCCASGGRSSRGGRSGGASSSGSSQELGADAGRAWRHGRGARRALAAASLPRRAPG